MPGCVTKQCSGPLGARGAVRGAATAACQESSGTDFGQGDATLAQVSGGGGFWRVFFSLDGCTTLPVRVANKGF